MLTKFEEFSLGIHELYRSMHKNESVIMNKYGLRGAYVKYLVTMFRNPEGLTISQICEICDQDKAAVSRAVSELVGREFIWRDNPKGNHYRAKLKLTERGTELTKEICKSGENIIEEAVSGLSDEQREEFFELMSLVSRNIHRANLAKISKLDR